MNKLIFKLFYSNAALLLASLVIALFLAGCNAGITGDSLQIPKEIMKNPEVYFCPADDCGKALEAHINSAGKSVYCAFYDLDLGNVIGALKDKSGKIDVKLVSDDSNKIDFMKSIKFDGKGRLMHNKFCVIDGSIVTTGSFNPTTNDNTKNNNNMVVMHSEILAENYRNEFDELWNGEFGKGRNVRYPVAYINDVKLENYFCPEDKCASRVIEAVKSAKASIYFMDFSFTSEAIADAVIRRSDLDVRGIFDSGQASSQYSQLNRMKEFGLNVRKDSGRHKLHHKVFIIDNSTVITGSFNPTLSGDGKNDENLLIVHDKNITDYFLKEFASLWK